jgi:Zn-dependent protease with chaperone function
VKYVPKELPEGINAPRTNALAELGLLAAALVAGVVVAFYALGFAADWLAVRLSPAWEKAIGERLPIADAAAPVGGREQQVLDGLLANAPPQEGYDIELGVLCTPDAVNAFALPGGRLVVMDGLLDAVRSENELAFVLAHELGHFTHRDHLRALGRGLVWMTLLAAVGTGGDAAATLVVGSGLAVGHRFSQAQELAADRFAAELLQRTYGHAGGVTDFLSRPALADGGGWFSTHPPSRRRVLVLEQLVAERGWQKAPVAAYTKTASLCAAGEPALP